MFSLVFAFMEVAHFSHALSSNVCVVSQVHISYQSDVHKNMCIMSSEMTFIWKYTGKFNKQQVQDPYYSLHQRTTSTISGLVLEVRTRIPGTFVEHCSYFAVRGAHLKYVPDGDGCLCSSCFLPFQFSVQGPRPLSDASQGLR